MTIFFSPLAFDDVAEVAEKVLESWNQEDDQSTINNPSTNITNEIFSRVDSKILGYTHQGENSRHSDQYLSRTGFNSSGHNSHDEADNRDLVIDFLSVMGSLQAHFLGQFPDVMGQQNQQQFANEFWVGIRDNVRRCFGLTHLGVDSIGGQVEYIWYCRLFPLEQQQQSNINVSNVNGAGSSIILRTCRWSKFLRLEFKVIGSSTGKLASLSTWKLLFEGRTDDTGSSLFDCQFETQLFIDLMTTLLPLSTEPSMSAAFSSVMKPLFVTFLLALSGIFPMHSEPPGLRDTLDPNDMVLGNIEPIFLHWLRNCILNHL